MGLAASYHITSPMKRAFPMQGISRAVPSRAVPSRAVPRRTEHAATASSQTNKYRICIEIVGHL